MMFGQISENYGSITKISLIVIINIEKISV